MAYTTHNTTRTEQAIDFAPLMMSMRGRVILPADPDFDEARKIYNGMIDRHPAAIAMCEDAADVIAAVNFARDAGVLVSVRSGGHSAPGLCLCDGGLVIDVSHLDGIRVDPDARTVRVGPGCTLGDMDHATHVFGLATPSGIFSSTGVGGISLGGGTGYLTRTFGLAIDNLLEADVVLANGAFVTCSKDRNQDLFWAIRGGGGNFGIVTSFVFRLHPVDMVYGGPMIWPMEDSTQILRWFKNFIAEAPDEVSGFLAYMTIPPAEPFPPEMFGRRAVAIIWCSILQGEDAAGVFAEIRNVLPTPVVDWAQPMPYPALQSMFDPMMPPGLQWYWKTELFEDLPDDAIAKETEFGNAMPIGLTSMHLYPINGAASRVPSDATAWPFRNATWNEVMVGVTDNPNEVETVKRWARDFWDGMHPYSTGGSYVNMMMQEGDEKVRASYGKNYERLAQIKRTYDPDNFFRMNQNIKPA
ncbi:MAG TPA: FAD-binding oxidoreductase [Thermomicrobiales bacterium]|nr:FAD-binding oxidoreductase [Thermomicrobiales bacterium]